MPAADMRDWNVEGGLIAPSACFSGPGVVVIKVVILVASPRDTYVRRRSAIKNEHNLIRLC